MTKDEALQKLIDSYIDGKPVTHELTMAFKRLLAEPAQEQHREGFWCKDLTCKKCYSADFRFKHSTSQPAPETPVVNQKLQTQPLTDGMRGNLVMEHLGPHALTGGKMSIYDAFMLGIKAAEAAYGIGAPNQQKNPHE